MASFKDICDRAKHKLAGGADDVESQVEEEEIPETNYDARNETVEPVTREVSQFERDFAATSKTSPSSHSEGLDFLFAPSAEEQMNTPASVTAPLDAVETAEAAAQSTRVDAGSSQDFLKEPSIFPEKKRQVAVIKPDSYEEAEIVTKTLKTGGLVIVDVRRTQDALAKRFLDFSFGATSALGGSVDTLEDHIYSISTGEPITTDELSRVKAEGLI